MDIKRGDQVIGNRHLSAPMTATKAERLLAKAGFSGELLDPQRDDLVLTDRKRLMPGRRYTLLLSGGGISF